MTDNLPDMPAWAREIPSAPVHKEQGGGLTRPFTPQQLQEFGKGFVEQFIARVVLAVVGTLIPGVSSFDQLREWAERLPIIGDIIRIINEVFGGIFGGIDFNHPPTPEQVWQNVVNTLIKPLNAFAELIGGLIPSWHIPGLDASKIISGKIAQTFLTITNIAANIISGVLSGGNIPPLDASKVQTGKLGKDVIPNLTKDMSTDLQAMIDAGINSIRDTPTAIGQAVEGFADALASIPTQLFNQFGGNNAPRASQEQANAAMAALVNTVNSQGAAINALQNIISDVGGFNESITFRPAETTVFTGPGTAPWTPPSWAVTGEYAIAPAAGGGGAGEGGSGAYGTGGYPADWATGTFPIEPGPYSIFAGGGGLGGQNEGLGFGDNGSPGDTSKITSTSGAVIASVAGGAGGEGARRGGSGQNGKTISPQNLSAFGDTFTAGSGGTGNAGTGGPGSGGAGGNGGLFGNYTKGGTGGPAKIWMRARAGIPAQFTSMGTLILPTLKLNTGVTQSDAMTAAGQWRTVPPGEAAGGYMLIIRANSAFTDYVYLRVWAVANTTHYELGRVASGVKSAWKTGTIGAAIPFNSFTLTSDAARTFTVGVNGAAFDSYNDSGATSLMGAAYRSGGWASSDQSLPGSMSQFAFLDTGTPARIVSGTVATAQGTNSTAYVDLATTGPSVTLNVPSSGEVTVDLSAAYSSGGAAAQTGYMGFALSGSNVRTAADASAAYGRTVTAGLFGTIARRIHLTGLTPGTTTFKAVYKTSTSTATFSDRNIIVEPKP